MVKDDSVISENRYVRLWNAYSEHKLDKQTPVEKIDDSKWRAYLGLNELYASAKPCLRNKKDFRPLHRLILHDNGYRPRDEKWEKKIKDKGIS